MSEQDQTPAHRLAALTNAHQRQRERISRVLHDEVGQVMSAAGLELGLLRMDLADSVPEIGARTAAIQKLLERAMTRVRELSSELSPPAAKEE
jgi:signal transduction histidine kinase